MSKLMIQDEQDYDLREVSIRIPYSAEYYDVNCPRLKPGACS